MMTFVRVVGIAMLFFAIYLLIKVVEFHRPRCPRCGHIMRYGGEDESDREVWTCKHCGERLLL